MLVAVERFDLRIPGSGSLKEKRLWQRAAVAVAAVAAEQYHARRVMHEIERFVERHPGVDVIEAELSLHYPEDE